VHQYNIKLGVRQEPSVPKSTPRCWQINLDESDFTVKHAVAKQSRTSALERKARCQFRQLKHFVDPNAHATQHDLDTFVVSDAHELFHRAQRVRTVARANRSGRQAWLAQLQIHNKGEMIGDITWTRLS
jgi:hypothetical protein